MATGLIDIMKRAALDAVNDGKMSDLRYGVVTKVDPLSIQVSHDFVLPEQLLVVPEHLKNYTVDVELEWTLANAGTLENHTHEFQNSTFLTINNALKVGDKVAMIRQQGGKSYFILDKI